MFAYIIYMSTCNLQNGGRRRTRTRRGRGHCMRGGEDMQMESLPSDEPVAASAPLPSDASEVSAPAPLPAPTPSNPTWEDRKAQGSALVEKGKEHAKNAGNMLSGFTESVGNGVRNVGSSITGFFSRSPQSGGTTDVNDLPNADSYGTPDSFVSSEQSGGRKYRRKIRKSRRKARKSRRKARKSRRRK